MFDIDSKVLAVKSRMSYPGFDLDVDVELALDRVTGLFGPSGGGKSTLLRIIAGLERNARGSVTFAAAAWQDSARGEFVPPHRRPVGYVFQDARLFPHLTVDGNLRFASSRSASADAGIAYDEVLATMNLGSLLPRRIDALSGGERQRVAIARTLLAQPRLLLLDEPLASLDAGRKGEILPYIENLGKRYGIPAVYVSHSVAEIAQLADDVIVLDGGRVTASGAVAGILGRETFALPSIPFETTTVLDVRVLEHLPELQLTRLEHLGQPITIPQLKHANPGETVRLTIRAGDVVLATHKPVGISVRNVLSGVVYAIEALADSAFARVSVDVNGSHVHALLTRHAIAELGITRDMPVFVLIKTASFDRSV